MKVDTPNNIEIIRTVKSKIAKNKFMEVLDFVYDHFHRIIPQLFNEYIIYDLNSGNEFRMSFHDEIDAHIFNFILHMTASLYRTDVNFDPMLDVQKSTKIKVFETLMDCPDFFMTANETLIEDYHEIFNDGFIGWSRVENAVTFQKCVKYTLRYIKSHT